MKKSNNPNKRVTMQMPIVKMMDVVEESVREFNARQLETCCIRSTFVSAAWKDCSVEFKAPSWQALLGNKIQESEGLLLEGDVEGDAKEVAVRKGGCFKVLKT